eukprot:TRINITY_DN10805_c0_g1_i3.p2 TRINITY_DN10805_c0_g1~~TRINITY_DN10805_c0_g1_i3.p2  ORF type:complete len:153 (+),score=14.18 TRINITY_DN10805_c0_g1_i3:259-717(+)
MLPHPAVLEGYSQSPLAWPLALHGSSAVSQWEATTDPPRSEHQLKALVTPNPRLRSPLRGPDGRQSQALVAIRFCEQSQALVAIRFCEQSQALVATEAIRFCWQSQALVATEAIRFCEQSPALVATEALSVHCLPLLLKIGEVEWIQDPPLS